MARPTRRWSLSLVAALSVIAAALAVPATRAAAEGCNDGDADGTCHLTFAAEPANAVISTGITSVGFNTSGAPVSVQAKDDNGAVMAGVTVTLTLLQTGTTASLGGTVSGVTNASGVVTFGSPNPLIVNQTGYYQLEASATAFPSQPSSVFQITSAVQTCSTSPCTTSVTGASAVAVNAVGDLLSIGLGGLQYSCAGYTPVSGVISTDLWQSGGTTIANDAAQTTIRIPESSVDPTKHTVVANYQVCYASTVTFAPRGGGTPTTLTVTIAGGGTVTFYVGLLPDCGTQQVAPCVLSRARQHGGVVIAFLGIGDYFGQG